MKIELMYEEVDGRILNTLNMKYSEIIKVKAKPFLQCEKDGVLYKRSISKNENNVIVDKDNILMSVNDLLKDMGF